MESDFDILVDISNKWIPPHGNNIIAIINNIPCSNGCETNFTPMISVNNNWFCLSCWENLNKDNKLSANFKSKLIKMSTTVRNMNIIRYM
jgi:hypothetical protein